MKNTKTLIVSAVLAFVLLLSGALAFAQNDEPTETQFFTFTEEEINASERTDNPRRQRLSTYNVDLQPGQAVLTTTFNPTRAENDPFSLMVTVVPQVVDGDVDWLITSVVADREMPSTMDMTTISERMVTSWQTYWRQQSIRWNVINVTITENDITYEVIDTGESRPRPEEPIINEDGQIIITESEINAWPRIQNPPAQTVSELAVDLQPRQVVMTGLWNPRGDEEPFSMTVTLIPVLEDGTLRWEVTAFNGDTGTETQNTQQMLTTGTLNIAAPLNQYIRTRTVGLYVEAVEITDTELILTVRPRNS